MIGQIITIKNHNTGAEVLINDHTDPNNVIALQSFPTFDTDIRASNSARNGAHGEIRNHHYYGGMSIVLDGIIVGENEESVWNQKKDLDNILTLPTSGIARKNDDVVGRNLLRLSFILPSGEDVFIDCSPVQDVSYRRDLREKWWLRFQIILRATMPFFIQNAPYTEVSGFYSRPMRGFKLPFTLPLTMEMHNQDKISINVTQGFAVVRMNGVDGQVIVNPTVENLTTGTKTVVYTTLSSSNEWVEVNGLHRRIVDNTNKDVTVFGNGRFITLENGINDLIFTAEQII